MRNSMLCVPFNDSGRTSEYTLPCGVTAPMTERWSRVCHWSMIGARPFRAVGLDHAGQQIEAGFVHEKQASGRSRAGLSPSTRATTRFAIARIAASSRWMARVMGIWGVHPSCLSRRDTWLLL